MKSDDWAKQYMEDLEELKPDHSQQQPPITNSDFYTSDELRQKGIRCGSNCWLHRQSIIVNPEKLTLGNDVRIDGYVTISTGVGINIGSNVHIAGYVSLFGGAGIEIKDYASIASGAKVYSVSDDVMGRALVGPCVPKEKRHLHSNKVVLGEHSVMSVQTVLMPGGNLGIGSVLLPFSLTRESVPDMEVWNGSPAKFIKQRKSDMFKLLQD